MFAHITLTTLLERVNRGTACVCVVKNNTSARHISVSINTHGRELYLCSHEEGGEILLIRRNFSSPELRQRVEKYRHDPLLRTLPQCAVIGCPATPHPLPLPLPFHESNQGKRRNTAIQRVFSLQSNGRLCATNRTPPS